jgi:hypothetical protein
MPLTTVSILLSFLLFVFIFAFTRHKNSDILKKNEKVGGCLFGASFVRHFGAIRSLSEAEMRMGRYSVLRLRSATKYQQPNHSDRKPQMILFRFREQNSIFAEQ